MLCQRCKARVWSGATRRYAEERSGTLTCHGCRAAILMLDGVAVGVGDETLAQLARFGLASTGQPLLESPLKGA
jgi:hypothetical protein